MLFYLVLLTSYNLLVNHTKTHTYKCSRLYISSKKVNRSLRTNTMMYIGYDVNVILVKILHINNFGVTCEYDTRKLHLLLIFTK